MEASGHVESPGVITAIRLLPALAALAACGFSIQARAGATPGSGDYGQGAVSAWVDVATPDYQAQTPAGDVADSIYFLLLDRQINVRARGNETFQHFAVRLLNQTGADERSQLTLYVDPTYQRLTLHWVRVQRDGKLHDRLSASRVTVLPVESELHNRIYSGEQSINLLIPDLRVGDVLEYAYSIDSVSPNFPGHFATQYDYVWSEPVHEQRIRLRHRLENPVRHRVHGGKVEPVVREQDGYRELVFRWKELAARQGESDVPGWYPFWPYIEFSNMGSWAELARFTADMYRRESVIGPATQARIATLEALPGTPEDRVAAALRMVQDEIRYASISIGAGSFRPNPPDLVLERNFGDCKDKSLLLANMLQALGVEAWPALVHSVRGRALPAALPTPYAFDHAIVRVKLGNRVLWFDPTISFQGGTLATQAQADYDHALVIDPETTRLEAIARSPRDGRVRDVKLLFDLSAGLEKPGRLEITSRYGGLAADEMRRDLTNRDRVERESDYLNYYAGYYHGLEIEAPIEIEDDPRKNLITTRERYRLASGFEERDAKMLAFELYTDELYGYSNSPTTPIRTAPLALAYPAKVTQKFEVRLPEPWTIRNGTIAINNPAFRYRSATRYSGNVLKLEYHYQALADQVAVADLSRYLRDIKRMSDDLGFELTYDRTAGSIGSGIAPYPLIVALLSLVAGIWLAMRKTLRYDPPPRPLDPATVAPVGISGWLIIPALNLVILTIGLCVSAIALGTYTLVDVWHGLPDTTPEWLAPWAQHGIVLLLGLSTLILPSAIATAVLFFRKRTSAPLLAIAVLWIAIVYMTVSYEVTNAIVPEEEGRFPPFWAETLRDLSFLIIWTAYLLKSLRVKATFIQRLHPQPVVAGNSGKAVAEPTLIT